jgi:YD repeat-containing protein
MLVAALSIGALLLTLGPAAAADVLYVYDAMGRLVGVVDAQGNAARYAYDSVGNLLGVSRVNATDLPGSVGITLVAPGKGKVGDTVRLFGKGFSATADRAGRRDDRADRRHHAARVGVRPELPGPRGAGGLAGEPEPRGRGHSGLPGDRGREPHHERDLARERARRR